MFKLVDPEVGFTSDVIRDPSRFVGRHGLLQNAMRAVNNKTGLIAVYGKRGVGKSSLLRQIQNMANGDYSIIQKAGLYHLIPEKKRTYYTVFYTCDSSITDMYDLLRRLCTDTDFVDGLLRLVPDKGKELVEFSRTTSVEAALDLKLQKWGAKGDEAEKYSSNFSADIVQTFRNFCASIIPGNARFWKRNPDGILIHLDEFDVIRDKTGMGSLIKSLSSDTLKFALSGISDDISTLVDDHASIDRLVEQGHAHVLSMSLEETRSIFSTATELFRGRVMFDAAIVDRIHEISYGFPYFAQLIGKKCVEVGNESGSNNINNEIYLEVLSRIRRGEAFPNLESKYLRAIGESPDRAVLLTLLAEEKIEMAEDAGGVSLKSIRATAQELDIQYIDQLVPRLIDKNFGPALVKREGTRGTYEFIDPVFRAYVRLRGL